MRVLVSFAGGHGHWLPTVPVARALAEHGHEVRYACQEAMVPAVAADGWEVVPAGAATLLPPAARRPLVAPDRAADERAVARGFADRYAAERADRLLAHAEAWPPDLVVRDEMDFGAAVAADVLGIPQVPVVVIAAGGFTRPEVVRAPLERRWAAFGLEADPVARLAPHGAIAPLPPSWRPPDRPLPAATRHIRPAVLEPGGAPPPRPARPALWVTLGTIMGQESGDLWPRLVSALRLARRRLPELEALVSIGPNLTVEDVGPVPRGVRVERWLPVGEALAASAAVVSHAGSGTVIAAIATGRPQVLLPMGTDQPDNADRCGQLGVGEVLDVVSVTPPEVADAIVSALTDPVRAARADALSAECSALPPAASLVPWLEDLAGG